MAEEMEAGDIKMVDSQRGKKVAGGSMMGVGVAVLGLEFDFIPDLGGLGQIELIGIALAASLVVGAVVFVLAG